MKIWILADQDISKYHAFKTLIMRFKKDRKEIDAELEIKSKASMWNSFFMFLRDPQRYPMADIIEIPHNWTGIFSKLGLLMELDYLIEDFSKDVYPPFMAESFKGDEGKRPFSMPLWLEIFSLHYRSDMIKEAKVFNNMDLLGWDDFLDICQKLKAKYKSRDFYPIDNFNFSGAASGDDVLTCVLNRGASGYFSADVSSCDLIKEEVLAGIEDYLELFNKKNLPVFQENFSETGFIKSKLSAMGFSWRKPIKINNTPMNVSPFPNIRRKVNAARSFNLAVSSSTKIPDTAAAFLKWISRPENSALLHRNMGVFSPLKRQLAREFENKQCPAYANMFPSLSMTPGFCVYPTFDLVFSNILTESAMDILAEEYARDNLLKKLAALKGEAEYLLSIY